MNIRHIVLAAALMTLQTTILYLLTAAAHAHAARVYRCGNSYQMQPCADASGERLDIRDGRTPEQVRQAQQAARKLADLETISPKRSKTSKKKGRASPSSNDVAIALSCRPYGARPFETCSNTPKPKQQRKSTTTTKAKSPQAQRPFVAKAAPDRREAAAEASGR